MIIPPEFSPLFHQPVRSRLCLLLNSKAKKFSELKAALDITDGNLDAHLKKLSAAGYLHSHMKATPRPHTTYQLSKTGKRAFKTYLTALTTFIDQAAAAK